MSRAAAGNHAGDRPCDPRTQEPRGIQGSSPAIRETFTDNGNIIFDAISLRPSPVQGTSGVRAMLQS